MKIIEKLANIIQSHKDNANQANYIFTPGIIVMNRDTWKQTSLNSLTYKSATIFIDSAVKNDEFVILGYKTKK